MIHNQEAAFHVLDNWVYFAGYDSGYLVNIGTDSSFPLPRLNSSFWKVILIFTCKIVIWPEGDRTTHILMLFL